MLYDLEYYHNPVEYWDINKIKRMIEDCEHNIRETTEMLNKAKIRLKELEKVEYKYTLQLIYVEPYNSDFFGHRGYYSVCVTKIPFLNNVRGDSKTIKEIDCDTYGEALKEFSKLKNDFKKFNPILLDKVPQHMKHTPGDL